LKDDDFRDVAVLGNIADKSNSTPEVMAKLHCMYEKTREYEQDKDPRAAALTGGKWSEVHPKRAEIYKYVGRDNMAGFVDPKPSLSSCSLYFLMSTANPFSINKLTCQLS
jgi:hypothetical protein